jgi:hypothetical protein
MQGPCLLRTRRLNPSYIEIPQEWESQSAVFTAKLAALRDSLA